MASTERSSAECEKQCDLIKSTSHPYWLPAQQHCLKYFYIQAQCYVLNMTYLLKNIAFSLFTNLKEMLQQWSFWQWWKQKWVISCLVKYLLLLFLRLADGEVGVLPLFYLFVLAQCPLFLSMLHDLLLHVEAFAPAHAVHVFQSLVFRVCFLTKV